MGESLAIFVAGNLSVFIGMTLLYMAIRLTTALSARLLKKVDEK
jgi:hypothetical protein